MILWFRILCQSMIIAFIVWFQVFIFHTGFDIAIKLLALVDLNKVILFVKKK